MSVLFQSSMTSETSQHLHHAEDFHQSTCKQIVFVSLFEDRNPRDALGT